MLAHVSYADSDDWQLTYNTVSQGMYETGVAPPLTRAQVTTWSDALALDPDQLDLLFSLQADAENAFRLGMLEYREAASDEQAVAQITEDWDAYTKATNEVTVAADRLRIQIANETMDELKLILSPDQEARWPLLEQAERRVRVLSAQSTEPYFNLDITSAISASVETEFVSAALTEMLERYTRDLDVLITPLDAAMTSLASQIRENDEASKQMWSKSQDGTEVVWEEVKAEQERNERAIVDQCMRVHDLCVRIAAHNKRAFDEALSLLDPASAEALSAHAARYQPASGTPGGWNEQANSLFNSRSVIAFRSLLPNDEYGAQQQSMFGGVSFDQMMRFQLRAMELARSEFPEIAEQWGSFMPVAAADLSDEQQARIRQLRDSFDQARSSIETRYARSLRPASESKQENRLVVPAGTGAVYLARGREAEDPWGKSSGDSNDDSLSAYREAMLDLDQTTLDQLRAMLTPEQRLSLISF